jgi:hypothetical protein
MPKPPSSRKSSGRDKNSKPQGRSAPKKRKDAGLEALREEPSNGSSEASATAMDDRERRIREDAYTLWENEGRPDGQAERHWRIAKSQLEAQEAVIRPQDAPMAPSQKGAGEGADDEERDPHAPPEPDPVF